MIPAQSFGIFVYSDGGARLDVALFLPSEKHIEHDETWPEPDQQNELAFSAKPQKPQVASGAKVASGAFWANLCP